VNGLRQLSATTAMNACSIASYGDENATESKEAKAQILANMRDKKGVSLVSIGEQLQSTGTRIVSKGLGEHRPKGAYNPGEYIITSTRDGPRVGSDAYREE
jgi:hypothetical protein